jgi:hypothetical protein
MSDPHLLIVGTLTRPQAVATVAVNYRRFATAFLDRVAGGPGVKERGTP